MINLIDAVKELLTVKNAITTIERAPKTGFKTTEFWSLILTQLAAVYMGLHSLIPPAVSLAIGIFLSLLWLGARLMLKHYHLSLSAVQGIPDLNVDDIFSLIKKLAPSMSLDAPEIKTAAQAGIDLLQK